MTPSPNFSPTPAAQPQATPTRDNRITVGLPRCVTRSERRFPLTPEGVQSLCDTGYRVKIESHAGDDIHYTDNQYTRCGATVTTHAETLACDIVIHTAVMPQRDALTLKRGTLLLTFSHAALADADTARTLLERGVTTVAIDLIEDSEGNTPFADILAEIDGRASMAIASSLLADPIHGKGILIGGVAGVMACETLIIGSNNTAHAAARSAFGLGAIVRMMDNDIYRLRRACRELGQGVISSSLHPRTLASALRTADIVVMTDIDTPLHFDTADIDTMKRGVITFDLSKGAGATFPSMPAMNLADSRAIDNSYAEERRVCYVNAGSAVPRTAAMALSNVFITMFSALSDCRSALNLLKMHPGMQCAALSFMGHAVNRHMARLCGVRAGNISLYISLS